jgi:hypothetical protein
MRNTDLPADSVGLLKSIPDAVRGPAVLDGRLTGADVHDGSLPRKGGGRSPCPNGAP